MSVLIGRARLLVASCLAAAGVWAAEAGAVGGRVVDARTGAGIAGARLSAGSAETTSASDGAFELMPPADATLLKVTAQGYTATTMALVPGRGTDLVIGLVPVVRFEERVDVEARGSSEEKAPDSLAVRPTQVLGAAGAVDNVFRVLQTFPGVSPTQEFSSRISVRGGGPDENLTVMDGVEIANPYRLQGLISAFNPETVQNFTLDAGAFGVSHGDRLSSLLTVQNRAGSESRLVGGSAAVSLTDGNAILEGKLPGENRGSWIVTGRRTYYDLVANHLVDAELPTFGDVQSKLVWKPSASTRLSVSALLSKESADASFADDNSTDRGDVLASARNDLVVATLDSSLGQRMTSRTTGSWYRNREALYFNARFEEQGLRSNAAGDAGFGQQIVRFTRNLLVRDVALREELRLQASARHLLEAGAEIHGLRGAVMWKIIGDRNIEAANGSDLRGGAGLPSLVDSALDTPRWGLWLQDRALLGPKLTAEGGLRLDHTGINGRNELSPRLALTFAPDPQTRLQGALGQYTQSPGYDKLAQSDYFVDLTHAGDLHLPNERSLHTSLALERDLGPGLTARAEAYYKRFADLIVGRLETEAERAARVALYDFPAALAASIPTAPQITTEPAADGKGRVFGLDLYLTKRATSPETRLTGWLSYTYGVANREAYGRSYPFDYDRRHALSLVDNVRVTEWLELATTLRLATGFPRTPAIGTRVAALQDLGDSDHDGTMDDLVPRRDEDGHLLYVVDRGDVSNLNSARLPFFARLDFRASFTPRGRRGRWLLYLDVINVLNRKNPGTINTTLAYDPTSDRPRLVDLPGGSIPRLPSVGVRFRF
jgi:outer membrane receptor for ferrienterochelin and colicin